MEAVRNDIDSALSVDSNPIRMTNQPKYTFLLPAYKARFFEEVLLSIKAQTFRDFCVLVSDDCSPEPLKPIFDRTVGDDSRFMFRRNKENMGGRSLVAHWNLLVGMCQTEWLIMASDDDVYMPDFLEEADKLLAKYPQTNLLRGRSQIIDGTGTKKAVENVTDKWLDTLHFAHRLYLPDYVGGIASYIYRTEPLKQKGMFPDWPQAWFSDEAANIMMADCGCCITQGVTFHVRASDINISSQWGNPEDSRKKVAATYAFYPWMQRFMSQVKTKQPHDEAFFAQVEAEYKSKVRGNIQNYIYHCPPKIFFRYLLSLPKGLSLCRLRMLAHYVNARIHAKFVSDFG